MNQKTFQSGFDKFVDYCLNLFPVMGCLPFLQGKQHPRGALMLRNHCNDWKQIQTVIDKFIKSGLESFLIHDQREENASDNFCNKISPTVTASSTLR